MRARPRQIASDVACLADPEIAEYGRMKVIKTLLLLLVFIVIVVVGGTAAFLTFADPNDYKAQIEARVAAQTGRTLKLEGDLEWAVWPKLRLKAGPLSLTNAPGFAEGPMLIAHEMEVAVLTLPLLGKRIEMDAIKLYGAEIHLEKNAAGETNWADLIKPEEEQHRGGGINALALGGVDIQDALISWRDATQDHTATLSKLNFKTGPLAFGTPIEFKLAADFVANQPALDGDGTITGTVAYDLSEEHYALEPLAVEITLRGNNLPNEQAQIAGTAALDIQLQDGLAMIRDLNLEGLGLFAAGELGVNNLDGDRPGAQGDLVLRGADLLTLFKALELPAATELARMQNRNFSFKTHFDANMETGIVNVETFSGELLGATVNGELSAERVHTDTPAARGHLAAKGADLPAVLLVLGQLRGTDAKASETLYKLLSARKNKAFSIDAALDADLAAERFNVPQLRAKLMDNDISAVIEAKKHAAKVDRGGKPAFGGSLTARGQDIESLLAILAQLQGANAEMVDNIVGTLASVKDKSYALTTELDADLAVGRFDLPKLSGKILGNDIAGALEAHDLATEAPSFNGQLSASGPDLPGLLAVVGTLQGPTSGLNEIARSLAKTKRKSFSLDSTFATNLKQGRIDLSTLAAQAAGLSIDGRFTAENINEGSAPVDGNFRINSTDPAAFLSAIGRAGLAKSIRSLDVDAAVKGTMNDLSITPLTLLAQVKGERGDAVDLKLEAGAARANLDKGTFDVTDVRLTGLGLNAQANLEARELKTQAIISGDLSVPEFNLRHVMRSLKQDLPPMADGKALTKVALKTAFKSAPSGLSVDNLSAKLDDTTITGRLDVADFSRPDVSFTLNVDALNADRYLAPTNKTRAVTPEAAAVGAAQLPLEMLRRLKIRGDLTVGFLQISGAKLNQVKLSISGNDGHIKAAPITAELYEGQYQGNVALDATRKEPQLSIQSHLASVQLQPLMKDTADNDKIVGTANLDAKLRAQGDDSNRLKKSLSGKIKIDAHNGTVHGVDVPKILETAEVIIESKSPAPIPTGGRTEFRSLTGNLDVNNGVIHNQDLVLDGVGFTLKGKGMLANLHNNSMKYDLAVGVTEARSERGDRTYNLGGYSVLVQCHGAIGPASCKPDYGGILSTVAKKAVQEKVKEKFDDVIGDKAGKALKKLFKF